MYIYKRTWISLKDYFDRYGFEDGEDSTIGWKVRTKALKILNENLMDTPISVEEEEGLSTHNICRLAFSYNGDPLDTDVGNMFKESHWEDVLSHNIFDNLPPDKKKNCSEMARDIVRALRCSSDEFDEITKDDITCILQTPNSDLPLLITKLTTVDGKKLLERLMKR